MNPDVDAINEQAVRVAMTALYDTHIEDTETAKLRGAAVQAVGRLAAALGVPGLIAEVERTPHSVRRRESPLWGRFWGKR